MQPGGGRAASSRPGPAGQRGDERPGHLAAVPRAGQREPAAAHQERPVLKKHIHPNNLSLKTLFRFVFCFGLPCDDSVSCITVRREKTSAQPPPDPRLPPPSCLLLLPTPKRGGRKAAVSSRTSMHILVDAGLKVARPPPPFCASAPRAPLGSFFALLSTSRPFRSCFT